MSDQDLVRSSVPSIGIANFFALLQFARVLSKLLQHARRKICDWVDDQIENEGLLTLDDFREKYIEITGAASKDWTKLNKRIRTRLNLRSVCTVEQYVGWRNKTRKRHKWRWERKS